MSHKFHFLYHSKTEIKQTAIDLKRLIEFNICVMTQVYIDLLERKKNRIKLDKNRETSIRI